MDTDALIDALSRETAPVSPHHLRRRLGVGIGTGAAAALLLVVAGLGLRSDLGLAAGTTMFWGKGLYTLSLGLIGLALTAQLLRPETQRPRGSWLVAVPLAFFLALAATELAKAGPSLQRDLLLEPAWSCVPLILMVALPLCGGLIWAGRRMAPTRLRLVGAAAGLAAGGFAATLYCLYCEQASATYVLTRYTAAIVLLSASGALVGPRLFRW